MKDGMFLDENSIISQHYGFTPALLEEVKYEPPAPTVPGKTCSLCKSEFACGCEEHSKTCNCEECFWCSRG